MPSTPILTRVKVRTSLGDFTLGIDEINAPISAAGFLAYVDGGHLSDCSAYRIVTLNNQAPDVAHRIEVIQWGWRPRDPWETPPLPFIPHEPTSRTGLRHLEGTLSMARRAVGTAGPAFFICIGDQPELDEGGRRNPDGAGFAAFGCVLAGQDTIRRIFARAEDVEFLRTPVGITSVERMP